MADNEVKIYVVTDTDMSSAENLQSLLEDIESKASETKDHLEEIGTNIDTSGLDDLNTSLDGASESIDEVASSADEATASFDDASSSAGDLNDTLSGLDSTGLQEANSNAQELAGSLSESVQGASELDTAMGALAGAAAAGGLMEMVDTAGRINDSWTRLDLTFGGVSDSMKQSINSVSNETGRSGGIVRDYFNQMGIAGVKNTELLSQSFEALSGRAMQTNGNIEAMENVMQRMVLSGNAGARQLTQLGISAEDLGRAMGVSADEASKAFKELSQEDRLRVLTQAMGDGKKANEEYKNSWQGVKDQASAAFAGLMGAVGKPILEMLIPIMKGATQVINALSDGFKKLPPGLQSVIGAVGAGAAIFTAFAGAIGVAGQIIGGLKSGIEIIRGLSMVSKTLSAVRTALSTVNMILAASEWAALGPIILVVAAVVALIAILWYLYNTNDSVRASIDNFIASLKGLWDWITSFPSGIDLINQGLSLLGNAWDSLVATISGVLSWLVGAWQNTVDFMANSPQMITDALVGTFTWIAETIYSLLGQAFEWLMSTWQMVIDLFSTGATIITDTLTNTFTWLGEVWNNVVNLFMTYAPLIAQVLFVMATGGVGAIVLLVAQFMGMPNQVGGALQNVIGRVTSFVSSVVSNMVSGATRAVSGFVSGLSNLAGAVYSELSKTLDRVMDWGSQIVSRLGEIAQRAWQAFVSGLGIGSPGYIQILTLKELDDTGKRVPQAASRIVDNLSSMATEAVDAWGTPSFGYEFGNGKGHAGGTVATTGAGAGNNYTFNLYGDIDNEDRMQKFIDAVVRELQWKNETAGRNIDILE